MPKRTGSIPIPLLLNALGGTPGESTLAEWFERFRTTPEWLLIGHHLALKEDVPTDLFQQVQTKGDTETVETLALCLQLGALLAKPSPKVETEPKAARKPRATRKQKSHEPKDDRYEQKINEIAGRFRKDREHRKTTLARLLAEHPRMADLNTKLEKAKLTKLSPAEYGRLKRECGATEDGEDLGRSSPPVPPPPAKNWREKLALLATLCGEDSDNSAAVDDMLVRFYQGASHNMENFRAAINDALRETGYDFSFEEMDQLKSRAEQREGSH